MKKQSILCSFLAILLVICSLGTTVFAEEPVNVMVDGNALNADTPAQLVEGNTMVPLRDILEALGLELKWDPATKTITASNKDYNIVLPVGSKTAMVNGKAVQLDVPARIAPTGKTMVPARFIAESAGATVNWDASKRTVDIKSENYSRSVNNTTNISNVTGSNININNNNVDNSVNNSNNTYNNYDYSTKINNNITTNTTTNTTTTTIGNMSDILNQIGVQNSMKNPAMLEIKYIVVDKADNKPLKDAVLFLNGTAAGISNDQGIISFGVYGYATNLIKVAKEGYRDYKATKSYTTQMEETIPMEAGGPVSGIADANLEKAIRDALGKPSGDLTAGDYAKIEGLSVPGIHIKNLEGIQNLTNLVDLNLSENEISDLKPLSTLKSLKHLSLDRNSISDIGPLSGLTGLEELGVGDNDITDIKPLEKLAGIKYLHLWKNDISDISVLSKLTNLMGVNLDDTKITDLTALGGLAHLNWLRVQVDAQVDITPIQGLKELSHLFIDMHTVPDWNIVFNMPQLQELGLRGTTNADIDQLEPIFNSLNTICFELPKLTDYKLIKNFTALQGLGIKYAQYLPTDFLADLQGLTYLELSNDSIDDVSFLKDLPNLYTLQMDDNRITDITAVGDLSKLSWLSLRRNQISDVSALSKLSGLKSLFLSGNPIKDYSPLSQIYKNLTEKDFEMK